MKLLIAGGGTGGHVFTGLAIAREWLSRGSHHEVIFVGTSKGMESKLVPEAGFRLLTIQVMGFKGLSLAKKLRCLALLPGSFFAAAAILFRERPDLVFGVGGYASFPILVSAKTLGISTALIEQNAIPGLANKLLGRWAERIFIAWSGATQYFPREKCLLTGNPVRYELMAQMKRQIGQSSQARRTDDRFHILIFGGSQGAESIDRAMLEAAPELKIHHRKLSVRHQSNGKLITDLEKTYASCGLDTQVFRFIQDMAEAYAWADLVICRAGAISLGEVATLGKPAILIPFPFAADNHQEWNARHLSDAGAGILLLDRELSGKKIAELIADLAFSQAGPQKLAEISRKILAFSSARSGQKIVDVGLLLGAKNAKNAVRKILGCKGAA